MQQVTIHWCPVCQNIGGPTNNMTASLNGERDLNVKIVDEAKGESTVECGRKEG
jgi:hypothetical protein